MKLYAVRVKPGAEPVLMSEGFAWLTFILGPLWLALNRAWIPAALSLATYVLISVLAPSAIGAVLAGGLAVLLGLHGHDLQNWALERRGYKLIHMVAARDREEAWMRLVAYRPDLAARLTADIR
ncbi:MAG: DUF2628 domain-containing protein [Acetobacteraceae bacterium]